jgi:gas vesicle protein
MAAGLDGLPFLSLSGIGQRAARQDLSMEKIMDKKDLFPFLLGLSVGVGITMLLAPKSGQETRALIKGKAGEGSEYLKQRGADVKQTAAEWVDKGKEALSHYRGSSSEAGQTGDQSYQGAVAAAT